MRKFPCQVSRAGPERRGAGGRQPRRGREARPSIVRVARRDESQARPRDPRQRAHDITFDESFHRKPSTNRLGYNVQSPFFPTKTLICYNTTSLL